MSRMGTQGVESASLLYIIIECRVLQHVDYCCVYGCAIKFGLFFYGYNYDLLRLYLSIWF